jgi:hypothetical protein
MVRYLNKEINYFISLIDICGHDGMSQNKYSNIIDELEIIKEKVEKDLIKDVEPEETKRISNVLGIEINHMRRKQEEHGTMLFSKSISMPHKWQTYELEEIYDLLDVIQNMFLWDFAVKINEHFYDIEFIKDVLTGAVAYSWSSAPSPHLNSSEIIKLAFRDGTWFRIRTDKRKE